MQSEIQINPQLCKTLTAKSKIKWPWMQEPKLDGLRGIVVVDRTSIKAWSRNGKPLWNTEHIQEELLLCPWRDYVLDGEFFTTDWNTSMSIVKTQSDHPGKLAIRYHVWDLIPIQRWLEGRDPCPLWKRRGALEKGFSNLTNTQIVESKAVGSQEEADVGYAQLLERGYEGAIIKDPESSYVLGTRSPFWLKMKPWKDADLMIVDAIVGLGKHQGRLGALRLQGIVDPGGKDCIVNTEVGTGFTDAEREQLWKLHTEGQLVQMIAEIKYQELTADGSCRFPVFSRLREDK